MSLSVPFTKDVPFTVKLNTADLSHRRPVLTGISSSSRRAQGHNKRDTYMKGITGRDENKEL
jgi:hypothetical protein